MFGKWFPSKSWQDTLIGTIKDIFNQFGQFPNIELNNVAVTTDWITVQSNLKLRITWIYGYFF